MPHTQKPAQPRHATQPSGSAQPRSTAQRHVPVLAPRIVEILAPALEAPGSVYVDCTLGMGGHVEAVLTACPQARAIGIDRDPQALALASERLAPFGERFLGVHAVYDEVRDVVAEHAPEGASGLLMDLGVSSLQLDETERGFAYRVDAPLDMRMDQSRGMTAAELLNTAEPGELTRILREYGEERFAHKIARAVAAERDQEPFTTSGRLVELLHRVIPQASQRSGGHPAKRTFQALRIAVNGELEALEAALPAAIDSLGVGGRIAVLAYHSLEDRLVKHALQRGATSTAPVGLPVELPEHAPYLRLLTRGAETASTDELAANPRATSARLRAAERIRATQGSPR